jgi:hypothetical protein
VEKAWLLALQRERVKVLRKTVAEFHTGKLTDDKFHATIAQHCMQYASTDAAGNVTSQLIVLSIDPSHTLKSVRNHLFASSDYQVIIVRCCGCCRCCCCLSFHVSRLHTLTPPWTTLFL